MRRALLSFALLLVVPSTLYLLGVFDYLRDSERVRADVVSLGWAAPLVWVLGHSLLEGLGVPATFMVIAAIVLWAKPTALLVCILGSIGGVSVGFYLSRSLARDWIAGRLPARFRSWEGAVTQNAFTVSFCMRALLFLAPGPAYVMGLSRARFLPCILGSALGCAPGLWLMVYWGPEAAAFLGGIPAWGWVLGGGLIALGSLAYRLKRAKR